MRVRIFWKKSKETHGTHTITRGTIFQVGGVLTDGIDINTETTSRAVFMVAHREFNLLSVDIILNVFMFRVVACRVKRFKIIRVDN